MEVVCCFPLPLRERVVSSGARNRVRGSSRAAHHSSPGSNSRCSFSPPSPARGEGKRTSHQIIGLRRHRRARGRSRQLRLARHPARCDNPRQIEKHHGCNSCSRHKRFTGTPRSGKKAALPPEQNPQLIPEASPLRHSGSRAAAVRNPYSSADMSWMVEMALLPAQRIQFRQGLWIPGSLATLAPRNDAND